MSLEYNIINNSKTILLIIPGGGYDHLSSRESIPVAKKFNTLNYNTCIYWYTTHPSTYNKLIEEFDLVINELSSKFENIILIGFSAGGHLAGLIGTSGYKNVKAMVLCYPVISFIKYVHKETRKNFFNSHFNIFNFYKYSINNRVNKYTIPTYIWTMKTDESVDYRNTLLMINKLNCCKIKNKYKIYEHGYHGCALADQSSIKDGNVNYVDDEIAKWPFDVDKFIKGLNL